MASGNVTIRRFPSADETCGAAADEFVRLARAAIETKGHFAVAFAGGSTPKRMYEMLAEDPRRRDIEWAYVDFLWGDERPVPPDHPDSNYRMVEQALLSKIDAPTSQVHRMRAEIEDPDQAAREYEIRIVRATRSAIDDPPPPLDLVLLGLGTDGHTASLFPETSALDETERWVVPNRVAKLNSTRLTLTYPILNRAKNIAFLVAGAGKAEVVRTVLEGPVDRHRVPSQGIRPESGRLLWFLDEAAAGRLSPERSMSE